MNQLASPINAVFGRVNRRQFLLLHFVISSAGLIKLSMALAGFLGHLGDAQAIYILAELSNWPTRPGTEKIIALLQFVLSVSVLFVQYAIYLILSKVHAAILDGFFKKEHMPVIALHFLTALVVNGVMLVATDVGVVKLGFFTAIWLTSYLWFSLYCLQTEGTVPIIPKRILGLLLAIIIFQYIAIFGPLIMRPMLVENNYLNIQEKTILKSGHIVDNLAYINEHKIAGFELYDPQMGRKDDLSSHLDASMKLEDCYRAYRYLRAISEENKYKFTCDGATNTLLSRGPLTRDEKYNLDKLFSSPQDMTELNRFFISSSELGRYFKNHVYSANEKDFIERNESELKHQVQAGWFFYHHNYYFGPMNALSLGADEHNQTMVYGWLNTVVVGALLERFGMMNYQGYFKVYFAAYLLYFGIFLFGIWAIFRRLGLVLLAAILSISALFLVGIEFIRLAPGFNPLRHIFDIPALYLLYRYLAHERRIYLIFSCLLALLAILWSKEFGLFLSLSIGGAAVFWSFGQGTRWRYPVFMGAITILAALVLFLYPTPGRNPTAIYMLWGVGSPPTPTVIILGALLVINLLLAILILIKQDKPYKALTIGLLLYSVQAFIYEIWYPGWDHIFGVATIHIILLVSLLHGWLAQEPYEKKLAVREALILIVLLLFIYLPLSVHFYWKQYGYYRTFETHQLYNWSFKKASLISTMNPALFEEASNLIRRYSPIDNGIFMISKYDHLLPVLAGRYNAMPYNELLTNLVSSKEVEVASNAVVENKPQFLFVDSDIDQSQNGEIPIENDPASIHLQLHGEARVRVMLLQNLKDVYARIATEYTPCEPGRLISVYCRKRR